MSICPGNDLSLAFTQIPSLNQWRYFFKTSDKRYPFSIYPIPGWIIHRTSVEFLGNPYRDNHI
jgi:hypothetical protein